MAFCPFYDLQCPESSEGVGGCAVWTHFGCCMIDKPGKPAIYTDPPADPVDVYIVDIFSANAKAEGDILIIYALVSDGTIHTEDDLSKFAMHLY
ncbi:MAG: hypothetical protein KAJ19_25820 [Gammaproteobacteria bacterium]|nr:hypothetical protein [Gammaproteobacteria bacterium]